MAEPRPFQDPNTAPPGPPGGPDAPPPPLLSVRGLVVRYPRRSPILQRVVGWHPAVDGVSFDLARGESLGLVGESGSGKSTVGRAILRLVEAAAGQILLDGQDMRAARGAALRRLRRRAQMIFQDPAGSLNPRMTIGEIIAEPLIVHGLTGEGKGERGGRESLKKTVADLLDRCGLPAAAADRYPHQFSGGQRQRAAIARALALSPALLVCDEPTSALDVSIQAQILNLLTDLQRERGLSYLFISHDLSVVQHLCPRVAVMHAGRLVETGPTDAVLTAPREDYTKALITAARGRG